MHRYIDPVIVIGFVCATMFGMCLGVVALPFITGIRMSAEAATLIGALVGSSVTVLGALVVTRASEFRDRSRVRGIAGKALRILEQPYRDTQCAYEELVDIRKTGDESRVYITVGRQNLMEKLCNLGSCAAIVNDQFDQLAPIYRGVGPSTAVAHYHMLDELQSISQQSMVLASRLRNEGAGVESYEIDDSFRSIVEFYDEMLRDFRDL